MGKDNKGFSSIFQMVETFSTEEKCIHHMEELRWAGKPLCPYCNHETVYKFASGKKYKCAACKQIFSIRVGTIIEGSNLPLQKWFMALYLLLAHKKGISSHQLAKDIGITQKSAWFVLHRLRHALEQGTKNAKPSEIDVLNNTLPLPRLEFEQALKTVLSVKPPKDLKKKRISRVLKQVLAKWRSE